MFQLRIITLTGVFFDKEIFQVDVPTTAGPISVNKDHAPLVGSIKPGILTVMYKKTDRPAEFQQVAVYEGTVEVLNNEITVLVDDVDTPEEVSEAEAKQALERAESLAKNAGDSIALSEAQSMMDRSSVRLELANLKKRRHK